MMETCLVRCDNKFGYFSIAAIVTVPLGGANDLLEVQGLNLRGELLTNGSDTITVHYGGALPQPQDWVAINEINYHSSAPDADCSRAFPARPPKRAHPDPWR